MKSARLRMTGAVAIVLAAWLTMSSPASAAVVLPIGSDHNEASAQNTTDGASVFRTAFAVRYDKDGTVDETNTASAVASCLDCRTVALAFQVVLVVGNANVVTPQNVAVAVNDQCQACLTYASATQLVIGVDGLTRLTDTGTRNVLKAFADIAALRAHLDQLTIDQLNDAVQTAKSELLDAFLNDLRPVQPPKVDTRSVWQSGAS
jgi:putative peptide zinc metalloprotease protein